MAALPAIPVDGLSPREILFVDDEISPFRTTGRASFEDTKTGTSGGGGVDLLLCDRAGSLVVGEIKAPGDSSVFMALIQSLTYAIELTTDSQIARLKACYPGVFGALANRHGRCEILLIYQAEDTPKLLDQSRTLATHLLSDTDGAVATKVRRIDFVKATLTEAEGFQGRLRLECVFSARSRHEPNGAEISSSSKLRDR